MLDILERLCAGKGKKGDIEELGHQAAATADPTAKVVMTLLF